MPQLHGAAQVKQAQDQREKSSSDLRHDENAALVVTVGHDSAVHPEKQHGCELQSGREADGGAGVVGQVEDEPVLCNPLHPGAGE